MLRPSAQWGARRVESRKEIRFPYIRKIQWDFFNEASGAKSGFVANISKSGCLLKNCKAIDTRRWVRLFIPLEIQDETNPDFNLVVSAVGRIVRREDILETPMGSEFTLFRYGIQFTQPTYFSYQDDLILALSSKNLSVLSCRMRNNKSSLRPGFLA